MIAYDASGIVVRHGDCRDELAAMAAESVQCVITSPPYFGLRKYAGLPDSVWGGDPHCCHEWGSESIKSTEDWKHGPYDLKDNRNPRSQGAIEKIELSQGRTCRHCSAWLGQLGNEPTVDLYMSHLIDVFRAVKRVLRRDGIAWVNLGDSYASQGGPLTSGINDILGGPSEVQDYQRSRRAQPGTKPKDLLLVPERFAIAAQADGWYVRSRIVWAKTSSMPESVRDRPTSAHETVWMLSREPRYFYDSEAVKLPSITNDNRRPYTSNGAWDIDGRPDEQKHGGEQRTNGNAAAANLRNVWLDVADGADLSDLWVLGPEPFSGAHFATFPRKLVQRAILASTSEHGACAVCGAPWRRVTETTYRRVHGSSGMLRDDRDERAHKTAWANGIKAVKETDTLGWEPTCAHNADRVSSTVLDPFLGSGTTAVVARSLGRRCVGVEGSAEYVAMSIKRIEATPLHLVEERDDEAMPVQLDLLVGG